MNKKIFPILPVVVIAAVLLLGCQDPETITYLGKQYHNGDSITVSGTIHRIGNARFAKSVLVRDGERRFIIQGTEGTAAHYGGKRVMVTGTLRLEGLEIVGSGRKVIVPNIVPVTITSAE